MHHKTAPNNACNESTCGVLVKLSAAKKNVYMSRKDQYGEMMITPISRVTCTRLKLSFCAQHEICPASACAHLG